MIGYGSGGDGASGRRMIPRSSATVTLAGAGLLDELHLWYHPVLAGVGEPDDVLLTPGLHATFETTGTTTFDNGVVVIAMQSRA